jgi:hypothetical protein
MRALYRFSSLSLCSGYHDKKEYKEMLQAFQNLERAEELQDVADKQAIAAGREDR